MTTSTVCGGRPRRQLVGRVRARRVAGRPERHPPPAAAAVAEVPHPPRDRPAPRPVAHAGHARGAADAVGVAGQRDGVDGRPGVADAGSGRAGAGGGRPTVWSRGRRDPLQRLARHGHAVDPDRRGAQEPRQRVGHPRPDAQPGVEQGTRGRAARAAARGRDGPVSSTATSVRQAANAPASALSASMCRSHASRRSRSAAAARRQRVGPAHPAEQLVGAAEQGVAVDRRHVGGRERQHPRRAAPGSVVPGTAPRRRGRGPSTRRRAARWRRPRRRAPVPARPAGATAVGRAASDQASCGSRRSCGDRVTTSPASTLSTVPSVSAVSTRFTGSTHPRRRVDDVLRRPRPEQRQQAGEPDVGRDARGEPDAEPVERPADRARSRPRRRRRRPRRAPGSSRRAGPRAPTRPARAPSSPSGESRSRNTSTWCAIALVIPHAAVPVCPKCCTPGTPGNASPSTSNSSHASLTCWYTPGSSIIRCGSPASSGEPDAVRDPCSAHAFEPDEAVSAESNRSMRVVAERQPDVLVPEQPGEHREQRVVDEHDPERDPRGPGLLVHAPRSRPPRTRRRTRGPRRRAPA